MDGTMRVQFADGRVHDMSVNDTILLTRNLGPFNLGCLLSEDHFKWFQYFVRRQEEQDKEKKRKRLEEPQALIPPLQVSQWQREFLDEIRDKATLDAWMEVSIIFSTVIFFFSFSCTWLVTVVVQVALTTNHKELERILDIRTEELEEEDGDEGNNGAAGIGGDEGSDDIGAGASSGDDGGQD